MFDKELLKLPGMKAALALLLASSLVQAALLIGQSAFLALALANLWTGTSTDARFPMLAAFFICFALRRVLSFAQDELLDRYAQRRADSLRHRVLALVFGSGTPLAFRNGTAATAIAVTEGADNVARYVRILPPKLCAVVGVSLPLLIALFAIDWVSGIIALLAFPVIGLFMVVLGRQASARAEKQFAESTRLSGTARTASRTIRSSSDHSNNSDLRARTRST